MLRNDSFRQHIICFLLEYVGANQPAAVKFLCSVISHNFLGCEYPLGVDSNIGKGNWTSVQCELEKT